jgi:hypothetical protein
MIKDTGKELGHMQMEMYMWVISLNIRCTAMAFTHSKMERSIPVLGKMAKDNSVDGKSLIESVNKIG